jgi:hypothetical protein
MGMTGATNMLSSVSGLVVCLLLRLRARLDPVLQGTFECRFRTRLISGPPFRLACAPVCMNMYEAAFTTGPVLTFPQLTAQN